MVIPLLQVRQWSDSSGQRQNWRHKNTSINNIGLWLLMHNHRKWFCKFIVNFNDNTESRKKRWNRESITSSQNVEQRCESNCRPQSKMPISYVQDMIALLSRWLATPSKLCDRRNVNRVCLSLSSHTLDMAWISDTTAQHSCYYSRQQTRHNSEVISGHRLYVHSNVTYATRNASQ